MQGRGTRHPPRKTPARTGPASQPITPGPRSTPRDQDPPRASPRAKPPGTHPPPPPRTRPQPSSPATAQQFFYSFGYLMFNLIILELHLKLTFGLLVEMIKQSWIPLFTLFLLFQWNLVCSDYWKIPVQQICFMIGWILGYVFLGTLCDWLGRRRVFLLSISLSCVLGVAVCLSSSAEVFLLLRLLQGSTLAGVFLSSYIARLELSDPPHRLMVTMISGFFAVFAELLLPGLAILCRHWPILQAVVTLPLLLLISYWCCSSVFPESPRWLFATTQIPQVKKSLQEFSKRNGVCLQEELFPGETLLSGTRTHTNKQTNKARGYKLMFIGTGIQYCFTRNLHRYSHNFYFTYFLRVLTGAVACIFLCLSVNHFGRRAMLLLSAIITGLSSLLLLDSHLYYFVLFVSDLQGGLVLVLSIVGLLFSQALAMLSAFFASEVMPTVVRGGCLGLVLASGCVGMAASSLMELQNNSGYFLHHVIFASFAVLSVLCIMLLPESKRKPLPDSMKDGESQRRPPLFLSQPGRDNLPLLHTRHPAL
uniref:Solute carrier family 22 member 31 n=1 Tax=Gouania willdenowi TaxID=441366 RepID=A0A8C5DLT9_GOUWI